MCQTHLFAQMLSKSTNTLQTFCLPSVCLGVRASPAASVRHMGVRDGKCKCAQKNGHAKTRKFEREALEESDFASRVFRL